MDLKTKVSEISGVGPAYAKRLERIGVETVEDLLFHFPRRYDDYSKSVPIAQIRQNENVSVVGDVWEIKNKKSRRGITVTEAVIADDSGTLKAVWFNQPFLIKTLQQGDRVALAGKLEWSYAGTSMNSPSYEKLDSKVPNLANLNHTGGVIPVYSETEGLSSKWLRTKIKPLLNLVDQIDEYLPEDIWKGQFLPKIQEAIREMHFPTEMDSLNKARERIAFDEMFLLQLAVLEKRKISDKDKASKISFDEELTKKFVQSLGFELTEAQRKSAWEILKDIQNDKPMNRLLEGDVGSGKTVVAVMAMLNAAKAGFQGVLLAPTEVLAGQHFESLNKLFNEFDINVALLTGTKVKNENLKMKNDNVKVKISKKDMLDEIQKGEVDILIGTHAVLNDDIQFKNLGLVIIDEQHRFGVEQRSRLRKESGDEKTAPHFLSMTATPIPRTLTLTIYGDLDVSVIDEMPKGRKQVLTRVVPQSKRQDAYGFIRKEVESGRQVFVICPLIEESDKLGVKSVESEYKKLKENIFPDLTIGLLHGKLKPKEKEEIMERFFARGGSVSGGKNEKIDILVSTSVIEVGVDIPNATIMMIEGAERFGLAQLHQFRGRVGRGEHKSYCLLFTESDSEITQKRLEALVNTHSGFDLAEKDLEIRGPGEVFGTHQHGLPDIDMKNLMNIALIKRTRSVAEEFLENNDLEKYPLLKEKVGKYNVVTKLE